MPKNSLIGRILSLFRQKRETKYALFRDGMGNFEIFIPEGWKYDRDIAVVDGRYTVSFQSPDRLASFSISVDAQLPEGFDFTAYAKGELESPESGIYTPVERSSFREMPAFRREYSYDSGGRKYLGGGVMFFTGSLVLSTCWGAPESAGMGPAFEHMLYYGNVLQH